MQERELEDGQASEMGKEGTSFPSHAVFETFINNLPGYIMFPVGFQCILQKAIKLERPTTLIMFVYTFNDYTYTSTIHEIYECGFTYYCVIGKGPCQGP